MSGTDQGMISSDPASASRADESLDAGFVQQLQQKQKTPKRLSKEILNQLGLRGGGMGGIQTGGTSGEETNFVEHIQRQQAGGLPQVPHPSYSHTREGLVWMSGCLDVG